MSLERPKVRNVAGKGRHQCDGRSLHSQRRVRPESSNANEKIGRDQICMLLSDKACEYSYLTGRIDDLRGEILTLVLHDPTERIFDGRIVALHEVTLDELHSEGRFACVTCISLHDLAAMRPFNVLGSWPHTDRSTAYYGHLPLLGG